MIKITEETEKEFYFSQGLKDFRGAGTLCYVNGKEYSFAVLKGTERGEIIVHKYMKKFGDVRLVFTGMIKDCSTEFKKL